MLTIKRAGLLVSLALTIMAALSVGTAHAGAFACSGPWIQPDVNLSTNQLAVDDRTDGVFCSGGTDVGWQMQVAMQYQSSSGAWDYVNDKNANTALVNLPAGGWDCGGGLLNHFANGSRGFLYSHFGNTTCGVTTSDYYAYNYNGLYDQSGQNLETNGLCAFSIKGYRAKYKGTDAGDSSKTDVHFSGETTC